MVQIKKICVLLLLLTLALSSVNGIGILTKTATGIALKSKILLKKVIVKSALKAVGGFIKQYNKNVIFGKRSVDDESYLAKDVNDCGKYLICKLAEDENNLSSAEKIILSQFDQDIEKIILRSESARSTFEVASYLGRIGENDICENVYRRCSISINDLREYANQE